MRTEIVTGVPTGGGQAASWPGIVLIAGLIFAPVVLVSAEVSMFGLEIGPEVLVITAAWVLSVGRVDAEAIALFGPVLFPAALLVPVVAVGCAASGFLVGFLYFVQFLAYISVVLLPALWLRNLGSIRIVVSVCVMLVAVTYVLAELRPSVSTDSYEHMYFRFQGEVVHRANILEFHPNAFAAMSTIFWLYALYWYELDARNWKLIVLAVALLVLGKAVLFTFSRSGFLAFVAVNGIVLLARPRLLVALAIAFPLAFGFSELLGGHVADLFFQERLLPTVRDLGGENPRWALLDAGIQTWLESGPMRIIFGFGFFSILFDSSFPSVLVNMGLAGVAIFVWLCYRLARLLVAILPERRLVWLAVGCMAGFAIYATFTEVWAVRKVLIPTFLLLGLLLAHGRVAGDREVP